jgi:cephalosporin hydroxylase
MSKTEQYKKFVKQNIAALEANEKLQNEGLDFLVNSARSNYSYNFTWMGRPIIQYPQDIVAMQEIIFSVKPDLIIETGIAHGGSLILYASLLELNAACGGPAEASILGVDIDIRTHNKEAIEAHPMSKRIEMIQGSSIATEIVDAVKAKAQGKQRIMVVLDSNHTHEHVLAELEAYAPLVTKGSYCVVFDTVVEDMPKGSFPDRPWEVGNNPKTAVWEYLKSHDEFEIDKSIQNKLLVTVAPDGFLKRN